MKKCYYINYKTAEVIQRRTFITAYLYFMCMALKYTRHDKNLYVACKPSLQDVKKVK